MLEHQLPFVQALRMGGKMRARMFEAIEQGHEQDFWRSAVGRGVYDDLLSAVRDSGVPEAVKQFEDRFFPLLSSKRPAEQTVGREEIASTDVATPAEDQRRKVWPGIVVLCLAVALGALIVGINAVRMTAAGGPGPNDASSPAAIVADDGSKIVSEPAKTIETEAAAPQAMVTESRSEATSEPEPSSLEDRTPKED